MSLFHNIDIDQWVHAFTVASFMLFLCCIVMLVIYAFGMPRKKLSHMATLPLDREPNDDE